MALEALLAVTDLTKYFPVVKGTLLQKAAGVVKAVDGISLQVRRGETLGLVGESGCGKSTTARMIVGLEKPTGGSIVFEGNDITGASQSEMLNLRRHIQMIFQDPYASLNPRMTVREIVGGPIRIHRIARGKEYIEMVKHLLNVVGLEASYMNRYPHEFSGGQRQRIGVARALALKPKLIICDEPVSALDVSIQAQVINLLSDLQADLGLTYIFIAHDLSVVKHISDRVAVMYLGKIVEVACKFDLYDNPLHPYTEALLSAIPVPDPKVTKHRIILPGDTPSPLNPPEGCRFHTRCLYTMDICRVDEPDLADMGDGHLCACHLRAGFRLS